MIMLIHDLIYIENKKVDNQLWGDLGLIFIFKMGSTANASCHFIILNNPKHPLRHCQLKPVNYNLEPFIFNIQYIRNLLHPPHPTLLFYKTHNLAPKAVQG